MDFSLWFPLEFLNQNSDYFSHRWVYREAFHKPLDLFSRQKIMMEKKLTL